MTAKKTGLHLMKPDEIDFVEAELNFEKFRELARNPYLANEEKIGFPRSYRVGFEDVIFSDILAKLEPLADRGRTIIDIGCGVGGVTDRLLQWCDRQGHQLVLVDSAEMLSLQPDRAGVKKVVGMFPDNLEEIRRVIPPAGADAILCYSVLHYIFLDTNLYRAIDGFVELLAPCGTALIGDIPNISKRNRLFSSETGIAFHKQFMNTDDPPEVELLRVQHDKIDDSVLHGLVQRVQHAGCDGYVVPQRSDMPMANRRDDILIKRP